MRKILLVNILAILVTSAFAQIDVNYKTPDPAIKKLAEAPLAPVVLVDESAENMILLQRALFTTIKELSDEEYRLAGLRINPRTNGQSRTRYYENVILKKLGSSDEIQVKGLPANPKLGNFGWSPDFTKTAFTHDGESGIELWVLNISTAEARRISDPILNDVFRGNPYEWTKDSNGFLAKVVTDNRKQPVSANQTPEGPIVSENLGKEAPARTYQDLLKNKADETNFEIFATSKIVRLDLNGKMTPILPAAVYSGITQSPDGKYIMVEKLQKPYSYLVPASRFPYNLTITDINGKTVKDLYNIPLDEERPRGRSSTTPQPRYFNWRADKQSSIYWVRALDDGDQKKEVNHRDAVYQLDAPFTSDANIVVKTKDRFAGIIWGNENLAIAMDSWWSTRNRNTYVFDPSKSDQSPEPSKSYSTENRYELPGSFVTKSTENGFSTLMTSKNGRSLYLIGEGYSPEGNRPFIDEYDIAKKTTKRLWRADGKTHYEAIVDVIDINKGEILTRRESKTDNPNYFMRNFKKSTKAIAVTEFPNPYESMKEVVSMNLRYKRNDDVDLNAILYLPPGYDKTKDGRLPVFLWAYPREFKNAAAAGQIKDSPHRFVRLSYGSPIYWAMRGYAVLDRTEFPIIGEGENRPNDTFVEQLVGNAQAAIDELDRLGIGDRQRIGVGGHSYGAFMTANLLAHSDLFAAGIARSGAYNRTLTPFGFQNEERTFWEAPDIYFKMSPFMHAHKIDEPLLLVHGTHDNNSGTFPMQSDRLFNAVKGHGGTVRLVRLPFESHGYAARESVMHMLWEMDTWLETYVKNKEKMPVEKINVERK